MVRNFILGFISFLFIFFLLPSPTVSAQECDPGSQCYACDTDWCSNGDACAAGHSYCVWDPEGNYCGGCVEEYNNCSSQCRTCDTNSICRTYRGPNYCCAPGPGNGVCNYLMGCKRDDSGGQCSCPTSNNAPTCGYVVDRNDIPHPCDWMSSCCTAPPPPSCNYNRDYNECNSRCNGTNYPPDHLVHVTEYTNPSGSVCRYDCNDLGRIPGQCGVPGNTQLYSCSGTSCVPDDNGESTDPNCGGQCVAPPPPPQTRYSCSGSSCVINASGPYTTSNCNNACSAPPGGCSVGWTLSNENPQPNSTIQVKVRGISDPQGWQNVQLWLDGSSNNVGSGGGIENPWPTFVYNNVPARLGGGHTLEFRTNSGSRTCAPSKTFTTQSPPPPPPTCTNTTPGTNQLTGCLWDGVNFNVAGGNAPPGLTNDPINNPLIPPAGDTVYSATALNQDWGLGGPPPPNDFMGSDTFSARWRGNFTFKKGTYTFKVGSDDGVRLKVDSAERIDIPPGKSWRDQSWDFLDKYTAQVVFDNQRTVPLELEYYENGVDAKVTLSWNYTPPVTIKPWIQTIGGDVHSNVSIKMRGN